MGGAVDRPLSSAHEDEDEVEVEDEVEDQIEIEGTARPFILVNGRLKVCG